MARIRKLRAVRAIVRPDRREEYLARWKAYARAARAVGAEIRLFEDQALPGRFFELTEHWAAKGMEVALDGALQAANLRGVCVTREGEEVLYRELEIETED
jgi:hypothetical protein